MHARLLTAAALAALCAGCMPAPSAPPPVASAPATPTPPPPPPMPPHPPMMKFTPPSHNPASVPSGTYAIEPHHTMVMFSVLHFGTSTYYGSFADASGTLTVDAKHPAADQLDVSVPINTVSTTSAMLTDELKGKPWLDAAAYPTMTFKSTKVIPSGHGSALVEGDLTLHGVTKPVTLTASFIGAGINPMMGKLNFGFTVSGMIKRSEFGVGMAVPLVSDETKLIISAAFMAQ